MSNPEPVSDDKKYEELIRKLKAGCSLDKVPFGMGNCNHGIVGDDYVIMSRKNWDEQIEELHSLRDDKNEEDDMRTLIELARKLFK